MALFRRIIRKLPGLVIKLVPKPEPEIHEGFEARDKIGALCASCKSCLLVTDRTIHSLGYHAAIVRSLEAQGVACTVFSEIASEPNIQIIEAGRKAAAACNAECIIALGGGSVLDSCKMIAAGARMKKRRTKSLLRKFLFVRGKTLPMICVPTTAGTGAELTVGAIVTKPGKDVKGSTVLIGLNVTDVVLDSSLSIHAPEKVTLACGIDALSHGLEGVVADVKVPQADAEKSMECVKLVLENLPALIDAPQNAAARQNMCRAALYGGNAINKQLAGYVHAFAHSIGAMYHIPHGEAIAISLLPVLKFEQGKSRRKLTELAAYCGIGSSSDDAAERLLERISELLEKCRLPAKDFKIPQEDYPVLIRKIIADSINYSAPVVMRKKDVRNVLDAINGT